MIGATAELCERASETQSLFVDMEKVDWLVDARYIPLEAIKPEQRKHYMVQKQKFADGVDRDDGVDEGSTLEEDSQVFLVQTKKPIVKKVSTIATRTLQSIPKLAVPNKKKGASKSTSKASLMQHLGLFRKAKSQPELRQGAMSRQKQRVGSVTQSKQALNLRLDDIK